MTKKWHVISQRYLGTLKTCHPQHPKPPEDCVEGYLSAVQRLQVTPVNGAKIVYTPFAWCRRTLAGKGIC